MQWYTPKVCIHNTKRSRKVVWMTLGWGAGQRGTHWAALVHGKWLSIEWQPVGWYNDTPLECGSMTPSTHGKWVDWQWAGVYVRGGHIEQHWCMKSGWVLNGNLWGAIYFTFPLEMGFIQSLCGKKTLGEKSKLYLYIVPVLFQTLQMLHVPCCCCKLFYDGLNLVTDEFAFSIGGSTFSNKN